MFWVHPKRFRAPKLFLGLPRVLLSVGDLFDRIRVTMPADRPGSVPRQEIVDILAYVLNANQFPAGETELPREVPALKQILFKASKP